MLSIRVPNQGATAYHAQTASGVFVTFYAQPGENHTEAYHKALNAHKEG